MTETSRRFSLPHIQPAQAQKHVTHNEAIAAIDTYLHLSVLDDGTSAPPFGALEGDAYLVPSGATGEWAGKADQIAVLETGVWQFYPPVEGCRLWVDTRKSLAVFSAGSWADLSPKVITSADLIGLGMAANETRPFSAKLNSALWTGRYAADGGNGDIITVLNRETESDDAGIVLQTDFSTRAIVGQFGSSDLRLAVSADGTNFHDGLIINPTNGIATQPHAPAFFAKRATDLFLPSEVWTAVPCTTPVSNSGGHYDTGTGLFTAPVDGLYLIGATILFVKDTDNSRVSMKLVKNGSTDIPGSYGEITGPPVTGRSVIAISLPVPLLSGDTVGLWGYSRLASSYFGADHTIFWGFKAF